MTIEEAAARVREARRNEMSALDALEAWEKLVISAGLAVDAARHARREAETALIELARALPSGALQ